MPTKSPTKANHVTIGHLKEIVSMPTMERILERQFVSIGARLSVDTGSAVRVDIRRDARGEYFEMRLPTSASADVVNTDARHRHLLLLVNEAGEKSHYLCGHDERHWFVAAIPESERGVVDVKTAQQALMPPAVRRAAGNIRIRHRHRRRNAAYLRQGEWFFIREPDLNPLPWMVLRHEPLSRGRGKFHMMEFAFRRGGTEVMVNDQYPGGLTDREYRALPENVRNRGNWRRMTRDAQVFAMGRIAHPDHATIVLNSWHRVFVNTESGARAMRHLAFLD